MLHHFAGNMQSYREEMTSGQTLSESVGIYNNYNIHRYDNNI